MTGRLLVFGSRNYRDRATPWNAIGERAPAVVIQGDCRTGADKFAKQWAQFYRRPRLDFPADWTLGDRAGPIRNHEMHRDGRPDEAIGFISGKVGAPFSRGSAGMVAICRKAGTPLTVYREDGIEVLR